MAGGTLRIEEIREKAGAYSHDRRSGAISLKVVPNANGDIYEKLFI
jgi:hypothetical protein